MMSSTHTLPPEPFGLEQDFMRRCVLEHKLEPLPDRFGDVDAAALLYAEAFGLIPDKPPPGSSHRVLKSYIADRLDMLHRAKDGLLKLARDRAVPFYLIDFGAFDPGPKQQPSEFWYSPLAKDVFQKGYQLTTDGRIRPVCVDVPAFTAWLAKRFPHLHRLHTPPTSSS